MFNFQQFEPVWRPVDIAENKNKKKYAISNSQVMIPFYSYYFMHNDFRSNSIS